MMNTGQKLGAKHSPKLMEHCESILRSRVGVPFLTAPPANGEMLLDILCVRPF